ncbi:TetR/AcrR family transcriptional regulator [Microbacterium sp. HD4P20]|uniref:TetR/AcrR family transcriptional regulator n=1 Tax=Microbacterium sp. HD4P20 TaxID=2864874 RepID=UPI001C6406FE|nr:TetR/AcrR family transcriptional regulator [Microbacterium sp. HD4P20]MCP2635931.1 TetR/AcrR family transcriptional regulator [Microbacterium sp. HD4P20]
MADTRAGRRGSYAKGVAKREEILQTALGVIAREGFRRASVKELADAVGLSQAGLLHYFDSKEELFTEILRKRDELDVIGHGLGDGRGGNGLGESAGAVADATEGELPDLRAGYVGIIEHNADVPGLVHLFARLSVDAADPGHPAHAFFLARGEGLRTLFASAIEAQQRAGQITDRVDAQTLARIFQAVADGMQLQWMLEPEVDMAATVGALFDALAVAPADTDEAAPAAGTAPATTDTEERA